MALTPRPACPQWVWLVPLALLALLTQDVRGEVFSSTATLRSLLTHQDRLLDHLDEYIRTEYRRLGELQSLVTQKRLAYVEFLRAPDQALEEVKHPTAAYTLVRDWSFLADRVWDTSAATDLQNGLASQGLTLPDSKDRGGAIRALIRLQRTYNVSIEDMANGTVHGHRSRATLGGRDFYDIGVTAVNTGLAQTAQTWLQKAIVHWEGPGMADVLHWTAQSLSNMYEYTQATEYYRMAHALDPKNYTRQQHYESMVRFLESQQGGWTRYPYTEWQPAWRVDYEALCRRDPPKVTVPANLWCEYQSHEVAYRRFKTEVMHTDPWIVMYYDVLSDSESEHLKNSAAPSLSRAVVGDPANSFATEDRISKVSWLYDHVGIRGIYNLSRRVQEITGLSTLYNYVYSDSEPFQVVNYGMGGQYEPHVDVYENEAHLNNVPPFLKGTGDRIATFMFYLSDVKEGGATVFPLLGVYVPPVKNAAAFWYNIHRSGTLDLRTQHAGCPVLVGEKWVANKWIREFGQAFRRPCGPTYLSTETDSRARAAPT